MQRKADDAITVHELDNASQVAWDLFVERCPEATFFHRAGWKDVIEKTFDHKTYFLYAERHGEIEGVLPLGHVKSRLFGNALISSPFCVYGGVAAASSTARHALENKAVELAENLGVDYLECRNTDLRCTDWLSKDLYVTFRKKLSTDVDENLKAIPRKQRAMVRKGINNGLKSQLDDSVERFYEAYAQSVHALGTPVFSKQYFETLQEVFGNVCDILVVTKNGNLISGVMNFYFRDEVLPYYGGGTAAARALKGNDFMYWELMRRSCERGIRVFDYGRSKNDSGSYSFKKNWGFEPKPLNYEYKLIKSKTMPDLSPKNPKFQLFIKAWQKMPYGMTKRIGPYIARGLG